MKRNIFTTTATTTRALLSCMLVSLAACGAPGETDGTGAGDNSEESSAALTNQNKPGAVVVFRRYNAVFTFGHVGWAYQVDTASHYHCGGIEGVPGRDQVEAGEFNGYWQKFGTWDQCLLWMKDRGYDGYRWGSVDVSKPKVANAMAKQWKKRGYSVINNNCANATWDVLNRFGVTGLPSLQFFPQPNDWFDNLGRTASDSIGWSDEIRL